jgi:tetratricopeptide (TPR) repeat protein
MTNQDDRWLWFIDDAPLQALLKAEGEVGAMRMRAASSPAVVRAMTAHMEGRTEDAAAELAEAIAGGERQPEAYLFLGQIHFEARRFAEAGAVYRQLVEVDGDNPLGHFNAGVCAEKAGHWGEAAGYLKRAVELDPERREAWLGLGLCGLHQRRPEEALKGFEGYLEGDPENEPANFGRAVALQMLRRFDEAGEIYAHFRGEGEPSAELLTNELALAVAQKDRERVKQVAGELERVRPGSRQVLEAQTFVALMGGEWTEAAALFGRMTNSDPLPEDWAYAKAYVLWRCGRLDEAKRQLDTLLESRPEHGGATQLRGVLLEGEGDLAGAMNAFRKAVGLTPDSDEAGWNLARLAARTGNVAACEQAAQGMLDRNEHSPEGWFATGLAALLGKRPKEAVQGFRESLRLRKAWPEAEWNLGLSLLESGEASKAYGNLETAARALEGNVAIEPLARAAWQSGRTEQAAALLAHADDVSADLLYNLAVSFHESGQMEEAETLYRRVIAAGPDFADAHVNLGHVLLANGDPEGAEEMWEMAKELESCAD